MDKLSKALLAILVAAFAGTIFIVFSIVWERDNKAAAKAEQIGCKDLGTARDMPAVRFFDCNGVIKLELIK